MKFLYTQNKKHQTVVDDDVYEKYKDVPWNMSSGGYFQCGGGNNKKFLHRLILDTPEGFYTDHINGNKLDNLISNLRVVNKQKNACNNGRRSDNVSGFKGVWYRKDRNKWQAEIKFLGKKHSLGCYDTARDAALAYNEKALEIHGEYARLNIITA